MTVHEAAAALLANLAKLPAKDQAFALSLLAAYRKGKVSEKQAYWIIKLAERATGTEAPVAKGVSVDVSGIEALLKQAGSRIKFPAFKIRTPEGVFLRVSITRTGTNAGAVTLTGEGTYPDRAFYGWVKGGQYVPHRSTSQETATAIGGALLAFAADPAGIAAAYGKKTGACCFCSRRLDDARSVEVGYGPTCADHYGLPWG